MARLTKFIRLTIYGFLDHGYVFHKIAVLGKHERASLKNSALTFEGKDLWLRFSRANTLTRHNALLVYKRIEF